MTGDGELQEGQIWESLQPVGQRKARRDRRHRRSQQAAVGFAGVGGERSRPDRRQVPRVRLGGAARRRPRSGGDSRRARAASPPSTDRPKVFIADTIKGKGVSFMEGLACGDQTYHFHAGAPSLKDYLAATDGAARSRQRPAGGARAAAAGARARAAARARDAGEAGEARARLRRRAAAMARQRPEIVVLDADLLSDCGIEAFREELPDRFIECGIAEQHMVSAAGGLALRACCRSCIRSPAFSRRARTSTSTTTPPSGGRSSTRRRSPASCPAGPGHSHQSVRDISAIGAVPGLIAFEPCSEREARLAIRWAVEENPDSTYLRFVNVPLDLPYALPADYRAAASAAASTLRAGADVAHRRLRSAAADATRGAPPTSSRGRASAPRSSICRGSIASTTSGCATSSARSR